MTKRVAGDCELWVGTPNVREHVKTDTLENVKKDIARRILEHIKLAKVYQSDLLSNIDGADQQVRQLYYGGIPRGEIRSFSYPFLGGINVVYEIRRKEK